LQTNTINISPLIDNYNLKSMQEATNYNGALSALLRSHASRRESILDLGAGRGVFANEFSQSITCVEPNESLAGDIAPRHTVFSDLWRAKGLFDMVYSINVLEHIRDDFEILQELRPLMLRGGRLILFVPARAELYSVMDYCVGHYRRYEPSQLRRLLERTSFKIESWRYFDFAGYFATLFCKHAGNLINWQGGLSSSCVSFYDKCIFPVSRVMDTVTAGKILGKNIWLEAVAW
jgi:SAM-dependent methyltransferase